MVSSINQSSMLELSYTPRDSQEGLSTLIRKIPLRINNKLLLADNYNIIILVQPIDACETISQYSTNIIILELCDLCRLMVIELSNHCPLRIPQAQTNLPPSVGLPILPGNQGLGHLLQRHLRQLHHQQHYHSCRHCSVLLSLH